MTKAKIFLGSEEKSTENIIEVKNPFNSNVVSSYPICSQQDARLALLKAKTASDETKNHHYIRGFHGLKMLQISLKQIKKNLQK